MARYSPSIIPTNIEELRNFLFEEFSRISAAFDAVESVILPELHNAPSKPREGMVVLADGTDWNPGSGAGFYGYRGAAWVLLG